LINHTCQLGISVLQCNDVGQLDTLLISDVTSNPKKKISARLRDLCTSFLRTNAAEDA
jgi:hypothetical protein